MPFIFLGAILSLKKQLLSYSSINVVNAAIPFLLLPILTRYLQPEEYGVISLIQITLTLLFPFILLNSQSLIVIEKSALNELEHKQLVNSILLLSVLSYLVLQLFFIVFAQQISSFYVVEQILVMLLPIILLFQVLPNTLPLYFQSRKEPLNYGKVKVTLSILNISFSIIFVVGFMMGWQGRLLGIATSFLMVSLGVLIYLTKRKFFKAGINNELLVKSVKFGGALIPHTIAGILLSMADKFIIKQELGLSQLGIYNVGFQIALVVSIIMTSINQAWSPMFYDELRKSNGTIKPNIRSKIYYLMAGMAVLTTLAILFMPFIFQFFIDEQYGGAVKYAQLICIAFMFQGWYFLVSNIHFYFKSSGLMSICTSLALVISIGVNFYLVPYKGALGAATTMVIVYMFLFILTSIAAYKKFNRGGKWKKLS